jgi:DNA-binding LacI/PurR family transcriptional regulator
MSNKRSRTTLKDVAARAGVSVMTVSNVVNGRLKSASPATRARISELVDELNYRPDTAARKLKLSRHFTIGMILIDENPNALSRPFVANLTSGICTSANEQGYSFVLQSVAPENFGSCQIVQSLQTEGICVLKTLRSPYDAEIEASLLSIDQPVISLQGPFGRAGKNVCVLRQDDRGGGRQLARLLLSKGARRILFLMPNSNCHGLQERMEGARAAFRENDGGEVFEVLTAPEQGCEAVQAALSDYLDTAPLPDAIMAGDDQTAYAALRYLTHKGIGVPDDVRITGFNAFDSWPFSVPTLTTIHSPAYSLGYRAGEALIARLDTESFAEKEIVLPTSLLVGETT